MSGKQLSKADKLKRVDDIKVLVQSFCDEYLSDELKSYAFELTDMISRKKLISLYKGKMEIWASSILYVIARLNFLFDHSNEYFIKGDVLFRFFDTKKTTVSNKAREIEDKCNLQIGSEGLCSSDISDAFTFYQTPEGLIIPKSMIEGNSFEIETMDDREFPGYEEYLEQIRRDEELRLEKKRARRTEINRKIGENKRKKIAQQFDLFS